METKMINMDSKLDDHVIEQRKQFEDLNEKLDTMDARYADKWAEPAIKGLYGLMGTLSIALLIFIITGA